MAASIASFKVESGIQLLARLTRKPSIENFYPILFETGPKPNEVIELYSEDEITSLIIDIACTAILPLDMKGIEAGVLIFSCGGHLNYDILISYLRNKIKLYFTTLQDYNCTQTSVSNITELDTKNHIENLLEKSLNNLFIVEIYDSNQFYTTIFNLETILMDHSNISIVMFDTITAFYWSEQSFKIMKMDMYLKKILQKIQRVTKEHKITIIYTRPEHFCSVKDSKESIEPCCENPTLERINYRIHVMHTNDGTYKVNIRTFDKQFMKNFSIVEDEIKWESKRADK